MLPARYLSIKAASHLLGVCPKTLRRWDKAGLLLPAFRTVGNHRRYDRHGLLQFQQSKLERLPSRILTTPSVNSAPRAAIYGRVSATRQHQTGDLGRQLAELTGYCHKKGYTLGQSYADVGSGLNDQRRGLLRLLRDVAVQKFDVLIVHYSDRLARFGIEIIRQYLASWAVHLEIIHPTVVESSPHAELITDLTAILYSFMGKLYRLRRTPS